MDNGVIDELLVRKPSLLGPGLTCPDGSAAGATVGIGATSGADADKLADSTSSCLSRSNLFTISTSRSSEGIDDNGFKGDRARGA